jgi:hypothetical protein
MICFQVSLNDRELCTAGVAEQASNVVALVCAVGGRLNEDGSRRLTLDVGGTADEVQLTWLENFDRLEAGDTITIRILERETADPPRVRRDGRTLQAKRQDAQAESDPACAFCHRPQGDSRTLIAGPPVFICSACLDVCGSIVREDVNLRRGPEA